jgi:meso-butanediol dehydrogenase/(S,S)-butanediol dehydrogenase/diacetyl reductase
MGRVVLVTGGARGIGRGIAQAFARAGCSVMVADLGGTDAEWSYELSNASDLERIASEQPSLATCELDVTVDASCRAAVDATLHRFGSLDVLVNNAGVVQSGPIDAFAEVDWERTFAVNTKGIFLMTRAALPALERSTDAAIVNVASIAGKEGHANMAAYCGSKFAAIGITQSLAKELAPRAIRVNALCPGIVGTAMWLDHLMRDAGTERTDRHAQFETRMKTTIPLGRPQTVEDMGEAAIYLATAPNVTGVALSVAGGMGLN